MAPVIRFVLGDQLSREVSSLQGLAADDVVPMVEVAEEATYVRHHKKKIAFLLGSKPYAAGGNYINRMSDFCRRCRYDVKQRTGEGACPFNYLYWDFLVRHRDRLRRNDRLAMPYRTLDRMTPAQTAGIRSDARRFLDGLEPAAPGWAVAPS